MVVSARINQRRLVSILGTMLTILVIFTIFPNIINSIAYLVIDIGYLLRPLYGRPLAKFDHVITHYYSPEMSVEERCKAHGWKVRTSDIPKPKVYDAIIFSVELDLLEIRLHELLDVVDYFVILESNATFTGRAKKEIFKLNRQRFEFANSKIIYKSIIQPTLPPGESPFLNENRMREEMTRLLYDLNINDNDLIIMSDTDQIINKHTIELLTSCMNTPDPLHLQLKNYIYSFEFYFDSEDWRASVHKWHKGGWQRYQHGQSSSTILTDCGWHCSFCFRSISDFRFKMLSYSHADRVRYSSLLDSAWIQEVICEGRDLYGMLPESYTFKHLIGHMGSIPKSETAVGLPVYLLNNREKFRYLLPGGCRRERE